MRHHIGYLLYLLRHKTRVLVGCLHRGIPIQGVLHDMDKFGWHTWHEYAKWRADPSYPVQDLQRGHQLSQPHHWEFWHGREMPLRYAKEMLADWTAKVSERNGDVRAWYWNTRKMIRLHPSTRKWIEENLRCE